jgi:hypothetical protein
MADMTGGQAPKASTVPVYAAPIIMPVEAL